MIGWQGLRFRLPADWNLTGFSMNRDDGYLRVDAPGDETLTVQVRWLNASKPVSGQSPTLFTLATTYLRQKLKSTPLLSAGKSGSNAGVPDLRANLERMLKETAKTAKKAKVAFDSTIKAEKTEGENDERTVLPFSWVGEGRGQGKIWYCKTCQRIVVAQVIGQKKDHAAIAHIATQLFASFHDHAIDGYDRWALYDLQIDLPTDFQLQTQKLLSGHLHLEWNRGAERIVMDRWGLANMTLKRFTPAEWFQLQARVNLKRMQHDTMQKVQGHSSDHYTGSLPFVGRIRAVRDASGTLQRFPTRYEAGIWNCPYSNKLVAVQVLHNRKTVDLWQDIVSRYVCHSRADEEAAESAEATKRDTAAVAVSNIENAEMTE